MGDDIINLSPGSITPTGQIVSGTPVQNQLALDQLAKQSDTQERRSCKTSYKRIHGYN
jgi:hypothetical protein